MRARLPFPVRRVTVGCFSSTSGRVAGLGVGLALAIGAPRLAHAQGGYQTPPEAILKIMRTPPEPSVSLVKERTWLVTTISDPYQTTLADLAKEGVYLAGRRFPMTLDTVIELRGVSSLSYRKLDGSETRTIPVPSGARITAPSWTHDWKTGFYFVIERGKMTPMLYDWATGKERSVQAPALTGKLSGGAWEKDDRYLIFTATTGRGTALWLIDAKTGVARRLTEPTLAPAGCHWLHENVPPLLCHLLPARRGPMPVKPAVPPTPIIQESDGRTAPVRTYQNMLQSPYDEQLFDWFSTEQLALLDLDGKLTPIGKPGIYAVQASPSGEYLLVTATLRPYSYQVGAENFPKRVEIWDKSGRMVAPVTSSGLTDNVSSARGSVAAGVRTVSWRPDVPATLVLVEALDSGNMALKVPHHDRVSLWSAPFTGKPEPFIDVQDRFGGIQWWFPNEALLTEGSEVTFHHRTWVIDPSQPHGGTPRLLWDQNTADGSPSPGSFAMRQDTVRKLSVPWISSDSVWMYLTGSTPTPQGDRPFLDRLDIKTGRTERIWQSEPPSYEQVNELLDADAHQVVTTRESATEPPNSYIRDLQAKTVKKLYDRPAPPEYFANVKGQLVTYARNDGVQLSATLYLPPGYDSTRGRLPFLLWAYPREFQSAAAASRLSGSPYRYQRPQRGDQLLMLAAGYGVLDGPSMPIVARDGKEPNDSYVEQLVASAQAAIDKIVAMGVADRDRIGVGGVSYGAFMTANLLAHSRLFRAGVSISGAYNRTLTPFGFQNEPRTYWQVQHVYLRMSPFNYADSIKDPLLLIHGTHDSNPGTFPIQSQRMYAAIKGNGGIVRYVQMPLEDHGAAGARESHEHLVWEMVQWLDKYVKNAKPR